MGKRDGGRQREEGEEREGVGGGGEGCVMAVVGRIDALGVLVFSSDVSVENCYS